MPPPRTERPAGNTYGDSINANYTLMAYNANMRDTNFKFFLYQADFEMQPETIKARKLFFEAEQRRRRGQIARGDRRSTGTRAGLAEGDGALGRIDLQTKLRAV